MGKTNIRDASRVDWHTTHTNSDGSYPGGENIKLGCLMRIAYATEAMAKNHENLILQKKWAEESRDRYQQLYEVEKRRADTYKGKYASLKKASKSYQPGKKTR